MLLLFELGLGGRADLDDGNAAREFGETLLQLLAIEVGIGLLDLLLDHLDAAFDRIRLAVAVDDRRLFLGDRHALGLAELIGRHLVELQAELFGDDRRAGERGDVLEHLLAAVAEARRLHRDRRERAAQLVDDERRERFALDVFGDDEQRLLHLDDLLEQRQDVGDRRDLALGHENVRIVEHGFHALGVGDHVRRDVALVELHAVLGLDLGLERLATPRP